MTQAAQLAQYGANNVGLSFKNRIINGDMTIDQRNNGAAITADNTAFAVDRFRTYMETNGKGTVQQNAGSVTPPAGFTNYLGYTSNTTYSPATSESYAISHRIEGFNTADLGWGTANAQTVTLSFWVRSSLTGLNGGSILNSTANRCYIFSYTVSAANTWEYKTVTIPGDTSGTWLTNNGIGFQIYWNLGSNANRSSTPGSWLTSFLTAPTGSVNILGTNGATWYITGVQLEKGTVATSFDYLPYTTELALCQRYYYRYADTTFFLTSANRAATGDYYVNYMLPVTMRAKPTSTAALGADISGFNSVTTSSGYSGTNSVYMFFNSTGTGNSYYSLSSITASAEL